MSVNTVPRLTIEIHPNGDIVKLENWDGVTMARFDTACYKAVKAIAADRAAKLHRARTSTHNAALLTTQATQTEAPPNMADTDLIAAITNTIQEPQHANEASIS